MTTSTHRSRARPDRARTTRAVLAAGALAVLGACAPPDRPPSLPPDAPRALLTYLEPDTTWTSRVAPGVWYRYLWSPRGPFAVHLLEVDLRRCDLGLAVARAPQATARSGGHARVSDMVEAAPAGALAAVNGDFFTPEGWPLGPEVAGGRLRTARARPALAWRAGSAPWIGTASTSDSTLEAGWSVSRGEPGQASSVVGGYPELLDRGGRVGDLLVADNPGFAASRHPRTGVAFDEDRARLWIAVVDGRQGAYSVGMTLPELTELFEAVGAEEALNLDGGGSSVMVVHGRRVSRPSDDAGERPVVNALVLRRDPGFCRLGGAGGP